jgi:ABC-type amino acid transport substrate-binding protein
MSEDKLEGFSIDLWQALAKELSLDYQFVRSVGISGTLSDVVEKRVDIAIGGLAMNEEREQRIDFTHPYFHTGLGILVPKDHSLSVGSFLKSFLTKSKLWVIGMFLLFMFICGHIIWIVERNHNEGRRSFSKSYLPGVIEGIYWAMVTASTVGYGDRVARSWSGRLLSILLIFTALPVFAYFVATLSSNITIHSLRSSIDGPRDLIERRVGVLNASTSHDYMNKMNSVVYAFDRIDDAYQWLIEGRLDAVVYDRPNLQFYAQHEGKAKVVVVGKTFAPQDYGIALPQGSPLREKLNRELLAMQENGTLERIRSKWFGHDL